MAGPKEELIELDRDDFPLIPEKSWRAIVRGSELNRLLLALIVDPLEAEDVAETKRVNTIVTLDDFRSISIAATEAALQTIATWSRVADDEVVSARKALRSIYEVDWTLGLWCDCAIVDDLLGHVLKEDYWREEFSAIKDWIRTGRELEERDRERVVSVAVSMTDAVDNEDYEQMAMAWPSYAWVYSREARQEWGELAMIAGTVVARFESWAQMRESGIDIDDVRVDQWPAYYGFSVDAMHDFKTLVIPRACLSFPRK